LQAVSDSFSFSCRSLSAVIVQLYLDAERALKDVSEPACWRCRKLS